ncbi:hypothetical protein FB451DRAFT_1568521 [Mycena latifolia]|nr:hypothetical protein FB451DRAFT_1568521 [Mycena latifolia]
MEDLAAMGEIKLTRSSTWIPSTDFAVALGPADLLGGVNCGKSVDNTFNGTTITTVVKEVCSKCTAGHIKLTPTAFNALTESNSTKSVDVVWSFETVGV